VFDEPAAPCLQFATKKNVAIPDNSVTLFHGVPGITDDWIVVDKWVLFDPKSVPAIIPPPSWPTTCYNRDSKVIVGQRRPWFISTPTGRDNFTVCLPQSAQPVPGLGPVYLEFVPDTTKYIDFVLEDGTPASGNVKFTSDNWTNNITVYLQYLNPGITSFIIRASSGGYDIPHLGEFNGELYFSTDTLYPLQVQSCSSGGAGQDCRS